MGPTFAWLAGRALADPKYRASTMVGVGRILRAVVFASLLLATWTLARPAHASPLAPFCDDRGATALAPAPALETPDEAIRRAKTSPCDGDEPLFGLAVGPAHRALAPPLGHVESAQPVKPSLFVPLGGTSIDFAERASLMPLGVRGRVERPPRD
jgi:hypothetical protein